MRFLTDFADLAVVLPLAGCVAIGFARGGAPRDAARFLAILAALLGFMLLLKLAVLGCAEAGSARTSPSGHTAAASFVYGAIAAMLWPGRRAPMILAGLAVAVLVGASRVALHAHSMTEVVIGGAAGVGGLLIFARVASLPRSARRWPVLVACLVLAVALHGVRLNVEPHLRGAGAWFGMGVCR